MEYTMTLPENHPPMPLRDLLEQEWLVPRKVRHFLRTRKNVAVNQQPAMFHQEVRGGDQITLIIEDSDYSYQPIQLGQADKVDVLFEDEHLLVLNKPARVKTHPNQPLEADTLLNDAAAYLAPKQQQPYVVHRLDKETSGVVLFAKNPLVLPILGRMLENKQIFRRYQATVLGKLTQDQTIAKKIGRDRHDRRKRIIDSRNGQSAVTHVTIAHAQQKTTNVYCVLETGRTHQIRVHLASIGHPVVGDPLYQNKPAPRLLLHGYELHLEHPFTKEQLVIIAQPGLW
ncbi:pseudouridine synthase, RluA family [Enterococcus casseliflavus ATCC 12755]|uniref:Pseudouridine synthase n=1 Tax=Enterococcus casseliflavus ATCC 12755 TaxID=888066 RepID=F0EHN5_ENTCA|nr:RluA family pseudouridine synthase [Enterococcus casseliflavus]EGC70193.1 pseudouridine synthase, RluA family [Enterococcus casseliflavus ATCC 12755]